MVLVAGWVNDRRPSKSATHFILCLGDGVFLTDYCIMGTAWKLWVVTLEVFHACFRSLSREI